VRYRGRPFSFAGEYRDPFTGLYNLRARQYDPDLGRFTARDPLGPQDYASPYAYVANNPLTYVDPAGLKRQNTCGSIWCFIKYSAVPACLNAINPLAGNATPLAIDMTKSVAAHRLKREALTKAVKVGVKAWAADVPIAMPFACLAAALRSGYEGAG